MIFGVYNLFFIYLWFIVSHEDELEKFNDETNNEYTVLLDYFSNNFPLFCIIDAVILFLIVWLALL